jgi:hypothetical protein
MPDRTEIIERLGEMIAAPGLILGDDGRDLLTAAIDLLEAGESRDEYRVTDGDDARFSRSFPVVPSSSYAAACAVLQRCRWARNTSARIQVRTTHRTPWVDVETEEADRG